MDSDDPLATWRGCQRIMLGALVLLVVGGFFLYRYMTGGFSGGTLREMEARLFRKYVQETQPRVQTVTGLPALSATRRGKVLLVVPEAFGGPSLYPAHWQLMESLRATPGEVDTVAFCRPKAAIVGRYTNGAMATQVMVEFWCFDNKTGEYLGYNAATGPPPPNWIRSSAPVGAGSSEGMGAEIAAKLLAKP